MNKRMIILGAAALAAGLVTAMLARNWLDSERRALESIAVPQIETREVLVARRPLPVGSFIKANDLKWQAWPALDIPGSFLTSDEAGIDEFVGAVIRVGTDEGQPISHSMVVLPGERGFMSAVLQPGLRAVSIPVSATTGISGFVFPGDRVDILMTHTIDARLVTETLLSDVRVLAVDQRSSTDDRDPVIASTVTLQVTPEQAKTIAVAGSLGQLSLSLRSIFTDNQQVMDGEDTDNASATLADFLDSASDGGDAPKWDYEVSAALESGAANKPISENWNVEVIRGPVVQVESF